MQMDGRRWARDAPTHPTSGEFGVRKVGERGKEEREKERKGEDDGGGKKTKKQPRNYNHKLG